MTTHDFSIPTVPLVQEAHTLAQCFVKEQATPRQGKRVYLNTLAVYAVHTHLNRLNIATDLSHSDSWTPGPRALSQPADLLLPEMGKLECCPVLPGNLQMTLPEVVGDRLGYVAVQFNDRLDEVQLIGVIAARDIPEGAQEWAISKLQPFSRLLDWLPEEAAAPVQPLVHLGEWFEHKLTAGWQTLETLLNTESVRFAFEFRGMPSGLPDQITPVQGTCVKACKVIDFPKFLESQSFVEGSRSRLVDPKSAEKLAEARLVLLISLNSTDEAVDISVRVCPMGKDLYLPAELHLVVWDQTGTLMQADTRQVNNWVQLDFSGQPGERFNLKVALGDVSITEEFQI